MDIVTWSTLYDYIEIVFETRKLGVIEDGATELPSHYDLVHDSESVHATEGLDYCY